MGGLGGRPEGAAFYKKEINFKQEYMYLFNGEEITELEEITKFEIVYK